MPNDKLTFDIIEIIPHPHGSDRKMVLFGDGEFDYFVINTLALDAILRKQDEVGAELAAIANARRGVESRDTVLTIGANTPAPAPVYQPAPAPAPVYHPTPAPATLPATLDDEIPYRVGDDVLPTGANMSPEEARSYSRIVMSVMNGDSKYRVEATQAIKLFMAIPFAKLKPLAKHIAPEVRAHLVRVMQGKLVPGPEFGGAPDYTPGNIAEFLTGDNEFADEVTARLPESMSRNVAAHHHPPTLDPEDDAALHRSYQTGQALWHADPDWAMQDVDQDTLKRLREAYAR